MSQVSYFSDEVLPLYGGAGKSGGEYRCGVLGFVGVVRPPDCAVNPTLCLAPATRLCCEPDFVFGSGHPTVLSRDRDDVDVCDMYTHRNAGWPAGVLSGFLLAPHLLASGHLITQPGRPVQLRDAVSRPQDSASATVRPAWHASPLEHLVVCALRAHRASAKGEPCLRHAVSVRRVPLLP